MYGYWTTTGNQDSGKFRQRRLEVICVCGTKKFVNKSLLLSGRSKSCGCKTNELQIKARTKHGHNVNGKRSPTYQAWANMRGRCKKGSTYPSQHRYAERGITLDERWETFENFLADMGEKPPRHDLDRKDNNLGYTPGNCRWVPHRKNCENRSTSFIWIVEGREYPSLKAASEAENIPTSTLRSWCKGRYTKVAGKSTGVIDPSTIKKGYGARPRYQA